MPTDHAFRLSTYLTLGLSCLCLGYAEWDLLPEATVIAGIVMVLLWVSFRSGGRHELDLRSANRVGLAIGVVATGWVAYQFVNHKSLIYTLPWPASMLPYLGPLLMILMPAKLFRPKHTGDWWAMQGVALAGVGLASSMAEDELFGLFLALYAVAAVATLALFFFRRAAGALAPVPHTDPGPTPALVAGGHPGPRRPARAAVARGLGWLAVAAAFGLPAFFLTPRSQMPRWEYGTSRLQIGYSGDQMVDLTRTGDLQDNREVDFVVRATNPDGSPKEDLNPNQRWRGVALNRYDAGRWSRGEAGALWAQGVALPRPDQAGGQPYTPPDLGPGQFWLEYQPQQSYADPVLADPVAWEVGAPPPVATVSGPELRGWWQTSEGAFRPQTTTLRAPPRYRQLARPGDDDLGSPFELAPTPRADVVGPVALYRSVRLPRLRSWTAELLARLAERDPRIRTALDRADSRVTLQLAPEDYEPVARALGSYLATSGEYKYTQKLRRLDPTADPIEEFLFRTKEGHCQRFAAALALMLRSVGVPANYVLGFKGCEPIGNGMYLIREEHAHAWVEVLVPRPTPPGFRWFRPPDSPAAQPPAVVWHWLSVDPTPAAADEEADSGGWIGAARQSWAEFFRNFIVGYDQDRWEKTLDAAWDWLARGGWLSLPAVAGLGLGLTLAARWRRRGSAAAAPPTGYVWFDRLGHALEAHGFAAPPGATPLEHAAAVSAELAARPETAAVAGVPVAVTEAFYLARYAGRPPTAAEAARLAADVARLQAALRAAPRAPRA